MHGKLEAGKPEIDCCYARLLALPVRNNGQRYAFYLAASFDLISSELAVTSSARKLTWDEQLLHHQGSGTPSEISLAAIQISEKQPYVPMP